MKSSYASLASRRWLFCRVQRIDRGDGTPYLWRLILLRTPWFALYLHVFLGSDDCNPHSHPWGFCSLILWGGYTEITPAAWLHKRDNGPFYGLRTLPVGERRVWYWPGSILRRPASWIHRIERGRWTPVTLVLTGRKCRSWGFYTPRGFVPWRQYSSKEHCN